MADFRDDAARWAAVVDRNPLAEGQFYYAVKSTGVYCRPTCPSRRPRRENTLFFDTAVGAEQAGFRPCRRCRPGEVSAQQQLVARAQHLLDSREPAPTLAELGALLGVSPYHLQRLFKQATGVSPKQYAAARRTERLKDELRQGATVTEALYDAGYGSARALYDQAGAHLGMSPGAYKRGGQGVTIRYSIRETDLGPVLVAATEKGICAVRFGEEALVDLRAEFPRATLVAAGEELEPYANQVAAYVRGNQSRLDLPLDVAATEFQQKVWNALRAIPYGQTRSYKDVAVMIGAPRAVRAVARACATNPVALVIPCHRVVRSGGDLSGYRWGVERKRRLLSMERTPAIE